jgi:hypothetical protein
VSKGGVAILSRTAKRAALASTRTARRPLTRGTRQRVLSEAESMLSLHRPPWAAVHLHAFRDSVAGRNGPAGMGRGKRHASSAVAAREGRSAFPRSALEPLLSKEEGSSPLLQFMDGLRDSRQIRDGGPRPPSLRWWALVIQKLKDGGTRINQLQHAEKLLERATSFRLSGNESKSVSEREMNE